MAQRTEIRLTDDITGVDIPPGKGETVEFGVDGQTYEIDLGTKNAAGLRNALKPYIEAGRRLNGARQNRGRPVKRTPVGADAATVKAWARSNGFEVSDRGRVPGHIREAFEAADKK